MMVLTSLGEGQGINNAGQVVGTAYGTPFLYNNGQIFNLSDLIDPALGLTLYGAAGINEQGQIITNGTGIIPPGAPPETEHAYLLTPTSIPEPTTWTLMGLALSGIWFWL